MRWKATSIAAILVAGTIASGCASAGAGANSTRFERDVGTGSATDVYNRSMKIIRQYFFELERETTESMIYLETRWRDRTPFADEQALGIERAQNRIIIRATPRSQMGMGEIYSVNLIVENRVQVRGSMDWTEATATADYRRYADQITEDLKRELNIGVRTFGTDTCCI